MELKNLLQKKIEISATSSACGLACGAGEKIVRDDFLRRKKKRMEYFTFQWHITEACDQHCKHCYLYAHGSHAKSREMTVNNMITVIENIQKFCRKAKRLPYLYITGGDPILHPKFWTLAQLLINADIPFDILGNPFHLTSDVCKSLYRNGCRTYQLSLDGLRETHDRIHHPGSFDETLAVVPMLRYSGIDVAVLTTVSRWNYKEVPALVDVVVKNKVDIFTIAPYCPDVSNKDICCSPQEYHWMMEECYKKFEQYKGSGTTFNLKDQFFKMLTILSDGSVYAYPRMESKVGNVLTDDLYDLLTGTKMDEYHPNPIVIR